MKNILAILLVAFLLTGCDHSKIQELEKKNASLQEQVTNSSRDLATQTQYVEEVTGAINSVYANMERISEGENLLSKSTKELEVGKGVFNASTKEHIINQLTGLDDYITRNKKKLDDLDAKLSSYRGKYQGLEKIVATLKTTLAEKESAIASLETRLKDMDIQVQDMNVKLVNMTETSFQKDQVISSQQKEINSALYVVGDYDELVDKGILDREGGFPFGWFGKTSVLGSGVVSSDFVTIDKYDQTTIEIPGEVDEIVPKRSEDYYTLSQEGAVTKLVILNPDKFWQEKYLVVVTM